MMHRQSENTTPRINTPAGAHAPAEGLPGGIKVIGVGRCGCNAVEHLIKSGVTGVDCIFATADLHQMNKGMPARRIQLCSSGCWLVGAFERAGDAVNPALHDIAEAISGAQVLFIVAGLGGRTGGAVAQVIANVAREMGIRTFGVVYTPFAFESQKRNARAAASLRLWDASLNMMTVVSNDKLLALGENISQKEAYAKANDVLKNAVCAMADIAAAMPRLVSREGFRRVWHTPGRALVSSASGSGPYRASNALARALECPLVADQDLYKAKSVLILLTVAAKSLDLGDFLNVQNMALAFWPPGSRVEFETVNDNRLADEVRVAVMVTGLSDSAASQA